MRTHTGAPHVFRQILLDFLKKSGRSELPWRKQGTTAYEIWVSEVMLQQTQVSRVIGYYERFLKKFPTVEKLARASWEEFLPCYAGLGYYARGRNMLRTAAMVVKEHGGKFPKTVAELEALPGIGPYTARAIASFAYNAPELAWDTNVKRVIGRFFLGAKDRVETRVMQSFNQAFGKDARQLNAALMDFGSALCTARPKCAACSLRNQCRYFRERGKQEGRIKKRELRIKKNAGYVEQSIVFLHERHKQYFSSIKRQYQPFLLPRGHTTRTAIKEYFQKVYGLTLAVRPAYREVTQGKLHLRLVNAQILLGKPNFSIFPKSAVLEYTKRAKLK